MRLNLTHIRRKNLEILVAEAGSATKLARLADTHISYLSQLRNKTPTRKGTPRAIGDDLALKLEVAMKKPQGWLDNPYNNAAYFKGENVHLGTDAHCIIPLISWNQADRWPDIFETFEPDEGTLLASPIKGSPASFVLKVEGDSMRPRFWSGDLIFVDPDEKPGHQKYVLAKTGKERHLTFKQLIIEDGRRYLKALNPDWPHRIIEMAETDEICGVIFFKGEILRQHPG